MNQPISVWTTALNQKRPYLSVNDAIRALHFILNNDIFSNQVYNVLSINTTVREIVEEIKLNIPAIKNEFVDSKIMILVIIQSFEQKVCYFCIYFKGSINEIVESINLLKASNCDLNLS